MDIEELLAAVSVEAPCGEDLAFSSELDAIARARQADDPSLEQGAWVTALKEADWKFVASGCSRLLKTRSKDLRLAVWLAEAAAKTGGLRALGEALLVTAGLCQRYWDGLYPLSEEGDHEQRIGNLGWVAARVAQLARELPVTEGAGAYSLNDFVFARSHAPAEGGAPTLDLDGARRRTPAAFYRRLLEDCAYCEAALIELERVVDARLGPDGPGFTAAKASLQDVVHFAAPLAGAVEQSGKAANAANAENAATPNTPRASAPSGAAPVVAAPDGPLQTRAQALGQLRAVAAFFRQTEPHSPVAYLADKAAHWGEQPLHVWLRAVIKDDVMYAQLEEMLGAPKPAA
ncbi:MAG: type secretion protein [Massilia sp.]|nr:type secretion protein [Massilia sp.]